MSLTQLESALTSAHQIILQENSLLKQNKGAEHAALLEKKKELLLQLDSALIVLKDSRGATTTDKEKMRALQDKIMQLLLLDRENEQLLLQQSVGSFRQSSAPKVNATALNKLYKSLN